MTPGRLRQGEMKGRGQRSKEVKSGRVNRLGIVLLAVLVLGGTGWAWSGYADRVAEATDRTGITQVPEPVEEPTPPLVLVFGDSYAAGAGAQDGDGRGWPSIVEGELGWNLRNYAQGGTGYVATSDERGCGREYCPTFGEMIDEAFDEVVPPDMVLVSGGRNDGVAPVDEIDAFWEKLERRFPDALLVATDPLWQADEPLPQSIIDMRTATAAAVEAVDGVMLDVGQPLLGRPGLISSDGVHPNAKGHQAIADAVLAALDEAGIDLG